MTHADGKPAQNNRIFGIVTTFAVTVIALLALNKIVNEVRVEDVISGLSNTGSERIVAALIFSCICYIALSGYDYIALKSLGKDIKWPVVLTGSTAAYAFSHNFGFAPITATYARFKVYKNHGVSMLEAAKVVVLTGTAFWLGVILCMGLCLALVPNLVVFKDWKMPWYVQTAIGITIINTVAVYFILISRGMKKLGFGKWSVPLPNLKDAIFQSGISILEMAFASAILWVLIPSTGLENYPYVLIAYVTAFIMVLITHSPGGVGVLEAVIILMLPEMPKAEILSALILFRAIFHLLPLAIGLIIVFGQRNPKQRKT